MKKMWWKERTKSKRSTVQLCICCFTQTQASTWPVCKRILFKSLEEQRRRSQRISFFFLFNINQIIDLKRKWNGAEIKSVRPDDVLFPLFPMQNSIPKSITLRWMEFEKQVKWRGRRSHVATALKIILWKLLKSPCVRFSPQTKGK